MDHTRKNARAGRRKIFLSGVFFLTLANLLVKVIGLLFKIPMAYYLGDEGMGYFNSAYQIYSWLYVLATAGLPVAVAILVSEGRARGQAERVRRVFRIACVSLVSLGVAGAALMGFGAAGLAALIGAPDAARPIAAMAPVILIICCSCALRGWFQGFQMMGPPAASQVLEAAGKLTVGVALAAYTAGQGRPLPEVAAAALLGLSVGEAAGLLLLLLMYGRIRRRGGFTVLPEAEEREEEIRYPALSRAMLRIALPVTVSASVMSLANLIDLALVQRYLQEAGWTVAAATAFYGNYTTLVVPMFNLPPALIAPIHTAALPMLTAAFAARDARGTERITSSVVRLSALIAIPCALGLAVFARPILALIFPAAMAEGAAPFLSLLAPGTLFLSLLSVTGALLQASGHPNAPTVSLLAGGAVKVALSRFLLPLPAFGTAAVPLGTLFCYLTALACNYAACVRYRVPLPPVGRALFRPFFASVLAVGAALGLTRAVPQEGRFFILAAVALAVLVYAAAVFLFGCVTREDLARLPGTRRLERLIGRHA